MECFYRFIVKNVTKLKLVNFCHSLTSKGIKEKLSEAQLWRNAYREIPVKIFNIGLYKTDITRETRINELVNKIKIDQS